MMTGKLYFARYSTEIGTPASTTCGRINPHPTDFLVAAAVLGVCFAIYGLTCMFGWHFMRPKARVRIRYYRDEVDGYPSAAGGGEPITLASGRWRFRRALFGKP